MLRARKGRELEPMPLYVERMPSGDVVTFGQPAAIELLDGVRQKVPDAFVRSARTAFASAEGLQAYQSAVVDLGIELDAAPATPELPAAGESTWSTVMTQIQSSPSRAIRATASGTGALVVRVGQVVRRSDD